MRALVGSLVFVCACSPFSGGSISPACQGRAVPETLAMLRDDTPLRRALAYMPRVPRAITGGWVQRSLANIPKEMTYGPAVSALPENGRACVKALGGPLLRFATYSPSAPDWTTSWAGNGVGERPYLACLAHQYDDEYIVGEVLPAPGSGVVIRPRALNGAPSYAKYYSADPELLFEIPSYDEPLTSKTLPQARHGALPADVIDLMRRVDVNVDAFEIIHFADDDRGYRTRTTHFEFMDPGEVRACYLYDFGPASSAKPAAENLEALFDLLDGWGSETESYGEKPDQKAVLIPGSLHYFRSDRLAGVEATVPLKSLQDLEALVDGAVQNVTTGTGDGSAKSRNRDLVFHLFQPRPGVDYE